MFRAPVRVQAGWATASGVPGRVFPTKTASGAAWSSREEDGPVFSEFPYETAKGPLLNRIQAGGRLVEDEGDRVCNQCRGKCNPLPVSPRELSDQSPANIRQVASAHQLGIPPSRHATSQRASISQVLLHAELITGGRPLRQPPQAPVSGSGLVHDIVPVNECPARGRRQHTGEHSHAGGLTCTVWTEKTGDPAPLNLEGHVVDGPDRPETPCHVSRPNHPIK